MKTYYFLTIIFVGISLILPGCDKEESDRIIGQEVELYLIESYETIDNSCQINENSVITKSTPLIYYTDFLSYDSNNCIFEILTESKNKIQNLEYSVQGLAFAIKVDNVLIYTGYFWPSFSSLSCNWVTIDPLFISSSNELEVKLGYPDVIVGEEFPDRRNDIRILDIFRRDNKLIE